MVGNGYSMGVAAEIAEDIFRSAEWPLDVEDPVLAVEFADEGMKKLSGLRDAAVCRESRFCHGRKRR